MLVESVELHDAGNNINMVGIVNNTGCVVDLLEYFYFELVT